MSENAFVPFYNGIIRRYEKAYDLPAHNRMDRQLLSGEIHLTMTARTPVLVGSGKPEKEGDCTVSTFFRNGQKQYAIPGSTIRGLVRQNMQILGLGLVRVGRNDEIADVFYRHNIRLEKGLPQCHQKVSFREDVMDYPNSILGFVGKQKPLYCYRSRVSFGELTAVGTPKELNTIKVVLKSPSDYFIDKQPNGTFTLPGTRQFPLKNPTGYAPYRARQGIRPLNTGTQFSGVIRYRNLHPDELGLLLWCLKLENGCFQTVGMAKSYGYGRMAVEIDKLVEYDFTQLYSSLIPATPAPTDSVRRVAQLIDAYQQYAKKLGHPVTELPQIRAFFALKKCIKG